MEQRSHSRPLPTPELAARPIDAARQLLDADLGVRLAAIRVLAASRYGPAQGSLCAIARARDGEEQVAALDALTQIPLKDDPELFTLAAELTHHRSRAVAEAAHRLLIHVLGEVTGAPQTEAPMKEARRSDAPLTPIQIQMVKAPPRPAARPRAESIVRTALAAETDGERVGALGGGSTACRAPSSRRPSRSSCSRATWTSSRSRRGTASGALPTLTSRSAARSARRRSPPTAASTAR